MSGINAEHLVFLDESGINTNLTRLYAHALHWKRAVDAAPLNTPTATTLINNNDLDEAAEVLIALGYKKSEVDKALAVLLNEKLDTNGYVKRALSLLVK